MKFQTYYMDDAVFALPRVIEEATQELEKIEFDTLVGTGFSGGIVVPALAMTLGKQFVLIRKETDDSHHRGRIVGQLGVTWVFVDDFISSGKTRRRVMDKVAEAVAETGQPTTMVGQYMYQARSWEQPGFAPYHPRWAERNSW